MAKKFFLAAVAILMFSVFVSAENFAAASFKEKKAFGFSPFKNEFSLRFWPSAAMGVDVIGGLRYEAGDTSFLNATAAGDIVLPLFEKGMMLFSLLPGLRATYQKDNTNASFIVAGGAALEFEVQIEGLSEDVTIGSNVGFMAGIKDSVVSFPGSPDKTSVGFVAYLASEIAVNPIYIRYYFK